MGRTLIERLGVAFARIGRSACDHRFAVVAIPLAAIAGFATLAPTTRIDTSFENDFDPDDPTAPPTSAIAKTSDPTRSRTSSTRRRDRAVGHRGPLDPAHR